MFQWKVRLDGAGPEEGSRIAARAFQKRSQNGVHSFLHRTRCQMTAPGTLDKARTPDSGTGMVGASVGTQLPQGRQAPPPCLPNPQGGQLPVIGSIAPARLLIKSL